MSRQATFSNTIHLQDFIDSVTDNPGRENAPNYVEIQTEVNIFNKDGFYGSRIDIDPIRTRIHAYLTREERELYTPSTFFYADGRFSAALSTDGTLEISVQALSLSRIPSPGALLSITAKVAGRATDTNQLALRVLDLAYMPRPAQAPPATPTPAATPRSKRSARWEGRATPSTPSKRQPVSEGASDIAELSYRNPTSQEATGGRLHLLHIADNAKPSLNPLSPLTIANTDESSITLAPSPSFDGGTRPHRSRHPPKKYTDEE
ncbi:hypothetical protein AUP68_10656 [Ilyonectria robusta]